MLTAGLLCLALNLADVGTRSRRGRFHRRLPGGQTLDPDWLQLDTIAAVPHHAVLIFVVG